MLTLRRIAAGALTLLVACLLLGSMVRPAQADPLGTPDGGGYGIAVSAVITGAGPGDPIPSGPITVSVPPVCWWVPVDGEEAFPGWSTVDPDRGNQFETWYIELIRGYTITFAPARLFLPTTESFKDAMRRNIAGQDVTWYHLESAQGVNCADEGFTPSGGTLPPSWGGGAAPISYLAVVGSPPQPLVEVDDLVESVWDEASQALEAPDLDRNPKLRAEADAALVNLPTWFWAQNPEEALAGDGEIHLRVSVPGANVQATLDATTSGMTVDSPAGSVSCTVEQATMAYAPGVPDDSACAFGFDRPNREGWTVTSSVIWTGTWQGADHNGQHGGELESQSHSATVVVPVLEQGSVVTEVD